jgi:predicted DNA-binding transcriptional regulator
MTIKLNTSNLKKRFKKNKTLTTNDIDMFYRVTEPDISKSTVNWRIYSLVRQGVIQRTGKGVYCLGETKQFIPQINSEMEKSTEIIEREFPDVAYCMWQLSDINLFSRHLINLNIVFVDVERIAAEAVYYSLKESFPKVMLMRNMYADISEFNDTVFVRPMISDSPVQKTNGIYLPTIEKFLVDVSFDKEFLPFQGYELDRVYRSALESYTVNRNKMLRYAGRKHKREETEALLKTINRQ